MWIVRLALRRPLSVAVMALLMLVLGVLSFSLMNVDIFPSIDLPVVLVVWNYPGLSAFDVERRMVFISERAYSTTVNGIEHIESESINGIGLLKVYFQPGSDIGGAIAQINAVSETILSNLPRGIEPPQIISYNASNVPVAQLNIFSDVLSTAKLFDYGLNFIRIQLFTIPGFSSPAPLGGVSRAVIANLDPTALYANGLSAFDVGNALAATNVVIPSGTAKMGNYEYNVDMNMSVPKVSDFNRLPIKYLNGAPVFLDDVAHVTDTHQPQTNVVRFNGQQATYLLVVKHADASTLTVVDAVKSKLADIRATAPKGLNVALTFDQSQFVRAALRDVVQEALTAAFLVAVMVLLFLGSPRSMLIVITSIPLSILTAIVCLKLTGQTINTMTLGGIALAVGMLVDDATVEVENIHRNHAMHKPLLVAILDGASQIATPTFVGTLSICIVFFPVVLLTGVAKFLFTPLALSVVFSMLTSYLLSRTLVPSMARYLLPDTHEENLGSGRWGRIVRGFDARFEKLKERYRYALARFVARRNFSLVICRHHHPVFDCDAAGGRRGFLPQHRRRHDEPAHSDADRNPRRTHRVRARPDRARDSHRGACRRAAGHQRQYRSAAIIRFGVLSDRFDRAAGRRRAHPIAAQTQSDRWIPAEDSRATRGSISECNRLLSGGRHREPGAQFRLARGHRRAD